MPLPYRFNRLELAGSLGDLGTLLPLALGMMLINGLDPAGVFFSIGVFYVFSGAYYRVTAPVQPMKVIAAYAIAAGLSPEQIAASALLMALFLLLVGASGAIGFIGRHTPLPVIRGVQVSTGILLLAQGVRLVVGTSQFQVLRGAAEPFLSIQSLGPVPLGIVIGVAAGVVTLVFLDNHKLPAGLLVVLGGLLLGLLLGDHQGLARLRPGLHLPPWLPHLPGRADLGLALVMLVLPQVPMTVGNAVIANADLSRQYFGEDSRRVTYRALCITMALANGLSFLVGGIPLCHGAGGLAAHYRFGARSAGSNLMIGAVFVILALAWGSSALGLVSLLPMSILGVLLIFAGGQLALTIGDQRERKDLFVVLMMLGITLASNLAVGFLVGLVLAYALRWRAFSI